MISYSVFRRPQLADLRTRGAGADLRRRDAAPTTIRRPERAANVRATPSSTVAAPTERRSRTDRAWRDALAARTRLTAAALTGLPLPRGSTTWEGSLHCTAFHALVSKEQTTCVHRKSHNIGGKSCVLPRPGRLGPRGRVHATFNPNSKGFTLRGECLNGMIGLSLNARKRIGHSSLHKTALQQRLVKSKNPIQFF